ncbi:PREDICTED: cysteine-rich hydrophobic domain-containing protein 2-like [Amphimedon queenslandica]|uniref:Golgin subfamily A member 7/ERF4 domain-containing protein n=1 Tax=Amphimedon queenslandica TaxID=400682 RepID=A0A1X7TNE4_AMPQE|nr:PREDICTED: cysteine-rich hydrophobic domain-containing protein 2-like [Amphimedon queenslandica]|eukprot:XP_003390184.1 PREDICTED: cysteine-rich hydrophobic domain-containing protein 2-like [Amphimedon queenslandica]
MADFLVSSSGLEQAIEDKWGQRTLDPWTPEDVEEDELYKRLGSPVRLGLPPFEENTGLEEEERQGEVVLGERSTDLPPPPPADSITYPLHDSPVTRSDEQLIFADVPDPVRLRGVGGTTIFGLNNRFDDEFPSYLVGKVAPEEFHATLERINSILYKSIPFNLKCLICGCLCCCCTLGISLGPVLYLSKRTRTRLEKVISQENWRLYNKLGLNIKLQKEFCDGNNLREYVIYIEFLPKQPLYYPD